MRVVCPDVSRNSEDTNDRVCESSEKHVERIRGSSLFRSPRRQQTSETPFELIRNCHSYHSQQLSYCHIFRPCECECVSIARDRVCECTSIQIGDLNKPRGPANPKTCIPPFSPSDPRLTSQTLCFAPTGYVLTRCSRQGHQSAGAGRGGPDAIDVGQRVAGLHQDVTVRGEFRTRGGDDVGGGGARHCSGAHLPRHHVGGTPEEDHEQRDGAAGADVRHLAGFPRVTAAAAKPSNEIIHA